MSKLSLRTEELILETKKKALKFGLPHLYGRKWYPWARKFRESRNKIALLTAGNQLSKSSTMIRTCIEWATESNLWLELWPNLEPGLRPSMFWYFYPDKGTATQEFETKWQEFLPRGEFKDHEKFGWKSEYKNKEIHAVYFKSGVTVYFKSYAQSETALQAGTVYAMFNDEETPEHLYSELSFRLAASDGYFRSVFTATIGQEFWRLVMEPEAWEEEKLPHAFKQTVSAYDCKYYEDGTPSSWTDERVAQLVANCKDHNEVLKRVWGKFVKSTGGRKYSAFDIKRHFKPKAGPIPKDWFIFNGTDTGTGGSENHPAATCFIAVSPDFKKGRVFLGWRGDGIQTTSGDVLKKFQELKSEHGLTLMGQYYDWANRDFFILASGVNEPFQPAEKSHSIGEQLINTLFENDMVTIDDDGVELPKLAAELSSLRKETPKNKAIDDFCFVAGTMIATELDEKPIEQISIGDSVLTRNGLRTVTAVMIRSDQVFEYEFNHGRKITCTKNHPLFTVNKGFLSAGLLTHSDTLCSLKKCQNQNVLTSTGSSFEDIQSLKLDHTGSIFGRALVIAQMELIRYIVKFGRLIVGLFLRILQFITKMETLSIIGLKILRLFQGDYINRNICESTLKKTHNTTNMVLKKPENPRKNGINQRTDITGTFNTEETFSETDSLEQKNVKNAEKNLRPLILEKPLSSVRMLVSRLIDALPDWTIWSENAYLAEIFFQLTNTQKLRPVLEPAHLISVGIEKGKQLVYNITVSGEHEYFANGILASNCDAFRYSVTRIPWDLSETSKISKDFTLKEQKMTEMERELAERRKTFDENEEERIEQEFEELNELYES